MGKLKFEVTGIGASSTVKELEDICFMHNIRMNVISNGLIFKSYTVYLEGDSTKLSALKTTIEKFT